MTRTWHSIGSLALAGIIAVAFAAAPVGLDYDFEPEIKSALAKGKGSGKGGGKSKSGKRGGSGASGDGGDFEQVDKGKNKNKGGSVEASLDDPDDSHGKSGNGHLKAKGNGHAKHHDGDALHEDDDGDKKLLGNLNAAHASDTARENASPNSMVGLLAAYAKAVEEGREGYITEKDQQQRLGEISNKSFIVENFDGEGNDAEVVDAEVVREVNLLLDVNNLPSNEDPVEE